MNSTRDQELDDRDIVELAALADGSLRPIAARRSRPASPSARAFAAPFAEQERAVGFTRSAATEVEAPASLRASIPERRALTAGTGHDSSSSPAPLLPPSSPSR
jgi:hypothetical protein